ncbi:2-oxoglutarate dehydrogenase E2 component [Rubritalea squalenifaciens DSM 18772]|uniref:Dihydrolipoyllysine-residue succinyltransferase n=1 Tax=Rubritalea squalenifaciens DSM 18772 TaxID=1123071 RepID=A0A1M6HTI7_9BACT|nr:dihydrolipoyllysine-residue succinyltransferase [Rubritalea squalenifaciens]SHJ25483.1 2-oxoglutarate dehydrogenase E2 component [Rubritalea squalenifaciens DSM 18772]
MSFEVIIPNAGESVTSANVAQWHKSNGDTVAKGDVLLTIETDKVSQELEAEEAGVLEILVPEGEEVAIGTVVAKLNEGGAAPAPAPAEEKKEEAPASAPAEESSATGEVIDVVVPAAGESVTSANVANWQFASGDKVAKGDTLVTLETDKVASELEAEVSGTIEIIVPEGEEVDIGTVIARITEGDAPAKPAATPEKKEEPAKPAEKPATPAPAASTPAPAQKPDLSVVANSEDRGVKAEPKTEGRTTRKKMTMLRRKIATHLVNAQQTAAILTTFNEVDMSAIMQLRKDVQEDFVKKHGCKLGFMSLFVKAVVQALKDVPSINARIDGTDIVENNFYDIGVAVGTEKGLVVPVLRDCEQKGFAQIEQDLIGYANKAREGKIEMADLQGGVFTISNGGVYGSLLSTPILNPPQSGILGMHTIQQRPVAVNGKVEIRPMMYLALSYDHRLVDGKEAVTFLIRIKECLENPTRLMLEM